MGVVGIGGLFFRSSDPDARTEWYREHLGIDAGQDRVWEQHGGATVFAPFAADTDYFASDQGFMLNLRVTDLPGLIAALEAKGVVVERKPDWEGTEYGSFARLQDPEGLTIELWEPAD